MMAAKTMQPGRNGYRGWSSSYWSWWWWLYDDQGNDDDDEDYGNVGDDADHDNDYVKQ